MRTRNVPSRPTGRIDRKERGHAYIVRLRSGETCPHGSSASGNREAGSVFEKDVQDRDVVLMADRGVDDARDQVTVARAE